VVRHRDDGRQWRKSRAANETQAQTRTSHPQLVPVAVSLITMSESEMMPVTSDRISQIMGQNLLKGFALLDEYCGTCEVNFLQ
jgi:hypothetical protein